MIVSLESNNTNIQPEKATTLAPQRETVKSTGTISGVSVDLFVSGKENDAYKDAPRYYNRCNAYEYKSQFGF